jgi:hypothetical protein
LNGVGAHLCLNYLSDSWTSKHAIQDSKAIVALKSMQYSNVQNEHDFPLNPITDKEEGHHCMNTESTVYGESCTLFYQCKTFVLTVRTN